MGAENFSDFLIPLKFSLDEPSKKKFDAAVLETEKRFKAIGTAAVAAASALALAVREISKNLAGLAYAAERVGASSEELKALGNAADRVGIGAEAAKSSLSAFFAFVNFEGGASAIKQWFNIDVDPAHPLKQMLDTAVKLADEYALGGAKRQTAIVEARRIGFNDTLLTTPGAARKLRDEILKDEAFTGGKLNPIAEKAKRLNAEFEKVKQHLEDISQLVSGSLQDAFSGLLETTDRWLKAHRDDIIWFSNQAAELAKNIFDVTKSEWRLLERLEANTAELMRTQDVIKTIREALKWLGEGDIASKINAALEWAFQPFKWLWDKLQSLGLVGPSVGGGGQGTENGGYGSERRRNFGHPGSGANLGKEGWWTPERQKHAYDKLRAGGLSDAGARGLISRWVNVESTRGPASENAIGGGHFGIGQWSRSRAGSLWGNTDFDAQLDHVLKEVENNESAAGKLLKDAKNDAEGARAATAYERAEHYERAGHGPHEDDWTDKTQKGMERVGKAISGAGKAPAAVHSGQGVIPGQGDPHKPGFDPSSVPFHHTSLFPLGHQHFASSEHHDNRVLNSNIDVKVAAVYPIDKTAHPLERTKNATLIRNTTATAS